MTPLKLIIHNGQQKPIGARISIPDNGYEPRILNRVAPLECGL